MQGDEMKSIRREAGMTQEEFGTMLGVTGRYVGMMENGEKLIDDRTADHLHLLARERISIGQFGDKFVVVVTSPMIGLPGRSSFVLPELHDTVDEAEIAEDREARRRPLALRVPSPIVVRRVGAV
jgi:transcriptional regulator with XRE-family HTH domain